MFEGKKKKAQYIKEFIADDDFYSLYNTLEQVDVMTAQAEKEKSMQQQAFEILFGGAEDAE
jgi:spore coat protein CotF